jgi:hypothetical protein
MVCLTGSAARIGVPLEPVEPSVYWPRHEGSSGERKHGFRVWVETGASRRRGGDTWLSRGLSGRSGVLGRVGGVLPGSECAGAVAASRTCDRAAGTSGEGRLGSGAAEIAKWTVERFGGGAAGTATAMGAGWNEGTDETDRDRLHGSAGDGRDPLVVGRPSACSSRWRRSVFARLFGRVCRDDGLEYTDPVSAAEGSPAGSGEVMAVRERRKYGGLSARCARSR